MSLRLTNLRVAVLAAASVVVPGVRDVTPAAETGSRPPIPIRFTLPEPAQVTLVIEDAEGQRVRNLVSETPFPAGDNVHRVYWTNKATGLTSDIPSEAELTPHLWGKWEFKEQ
jgi:hypothetical protein